MLERLDRLKGYERYEDADIAELDDEDASPRAKDLGHRRRLRELRTVLKVYVKPPLSPENPELNAHFAREEFGLDDVDTEILMLLLRYERNEELELFADDVFKRLAFLQVPLARSSGSILVTCIAISGRAVP